MKTIGLSLLAIFALSCYSPRNPHRLPAPVEFNIGMTKTEFVQKNNRKSYELVRADENQTIYHAKTDKWKHMYLFFINDTLRVADVQLTDPKQVIEIKNVVTDE